jgi:two-component system, OmpR family, phosphate regulon sensor histidine kinase PhoR
VETLEGGAMEDPEAGPDFLRRMHVEVDGLAQLVTELLELARIEAGRLDLDLQRCRADEPVRDAVERIRPYAARVSLSVDSTVPPDQASVMADARRVGQVLSNLLSNAVKFTPPGGRIQASLRQVDGSVEISVSDTGVGIASDRLIRVFERFYKIDPSRRQRNRARAGYLQARRSRTTGRNLGLEPWTRPGRDIHVHAPLAEATAQHSVSQRPAGGRDVGCLSARDGYRVMV